MIATEVKPNTLVQYQGGGYEGCFWQWNFAYFDKDGKFHCIVATGCKGCNTEKEMLAFLESARTTGRRQEVYLYDLDDEEDIKEFGVEANPDHAIGVAKWFAEKNIDVNFVTVCDDCGETVPVLECQGEGMRSCGGVVYCHDKTICNSCHEAGSCPYCGDFVGADRIHPETGLCHDKNQSGEWVDGCGWCHEEHGDEWN